MWKIIGLHEVLLTTSNRVNKNVLVASNIPFGYNINWTFNTDLNQECSFLGKKACIGSNWTRCKLEQVYCIT